MSVPILAWSLTSSSGSVNGFSCSSSAPALIQRSFMICCKWQQRKRTISQLVERLTGKQLIEG